MMLFIDTANIEEIKLANELGVISGVTTNPSLIAKEGKDIKEVIKEISEIVSGPISAEVMSLDADNMVNEAIELSKINENVVVKLPICEESLKATKKLSELGINTNITLVFSPVQALLAARAGATYVSPFVGRVDDIGSRGVELVKQIVTIFKCHNIKSKVIAASIRNPIHVLDVALVGADIVTIPFNIIRQMTKHNLTDVGIEKFINDYKVCLNK